jgi:gliding motility-associated-like protein
MAVNGQAPFTYGWSNGATSASVNTFAAGNYTVTITDAWGCTAQAAVEISPAPVIGLDEIVLSHTTCGEIIGQEVTILPGSAEFFPEGGVPPFGYSIDGGVTFQENPLFENLDPGTYNAVLMDANACSFDTTFEILEVVLPTVEIITSGDFNLCDGGSINLSLETTGMIESILWSTDDTEAFVTLSESGLVNVIITDDKGCPAFASVVIDDCSDYRIPNVFTPNNDGYNDEFKVYSAGGVTVKQMKIFNRWGNLVYEGTEAWNGDYKGQPHQADVLIYIIVLETLEGEVIEEGEITLLR